MIGRSYKSVHEYRAIVGTLLRDTPGGRLRTAGLLLYFSGAVLGRAGGLVNAFLGALRDSLTGVLCRSAGVFAGIFDVLTGPLCVILRAVLRQRYADG
jgi:hypothetical protein